MITRREFIGVVGTLATGTAWRAEAQQVARIGWLQLSSTGMYADITGRGFVKGLREAGYEEGRNLVFVKRAAEMDMRRLRTLARELVAAKVDVIFAPAKPMADAAWYASRSIPTAIATVTDPVVVDYAVSLARPGKHITGLKRVGTLIDEGLLDSCSEELDLMDKAAKRLGIAIERLPVTLDALDLEGAIKRAAGRVQALVTAPMTSNEDVTDKVAALATKYRLPFVHDVPQLAGDALAVYGPDFEDIFRRAGHYVARILKGEKPAAMAIEEPREFRMIVNKRVARALGLTLSQAVLLRADEVIE